MNEYRQPSRTLERGPDKPGAQAGSADPAGPRHSARAVRWGSPRSERPAGYRCPILAVETPFRDFQRFWSEARAEPAERQAELWDALYAGRHPELISYYAETFGTDELLKSSLAGYEALAGKLEERYRALELERAAGEVGELLDVSIACRVIVLVGLFTADAWAEEDYRGAPTVFFALEQLDAQPCSRLLVLHEFAHLAHRQARGEEWPDFVVGLDLVREGVALATTRRLLPEAPPDRQFAVTDYRAYEEACRAAWPHVVDELLAQLEAEDERQCKRFFWPDWGRELQDVPARVGYLVGARLVDSLLERHQLTDLVRWPAERALREVRDALSASR